MDSFSTKPVLVSVESVTKKYQRGKVAVPVLRELSCQIRQKDFAFIVGPSGSGKSTLLYLLGGLDQPTSGEITIAGQRLSAMSQKELNEFRRRDVGFVFQSFNLLKTMNCLDNVLAPFIPTNEASSKRLAAQELLERVGLKDRMNHKPFELSGGEQQRVAIARAILKQPKLILADEPTGELDSETGEQVFALLRELNQTAGTTIVTVTHDHRYLNEDEDLVFRMRDGRFIEDEE